MHGIQLFATSQSHKLWYKLIKNDSKTNFHIFLIIIPTLVTIYVENNEETLSNEQTNFKSYYYPLESLKRSKVYHFLPDNKNDSELFWVLSLKKENNKTYLLTDSYAKDSLGNLSHIEVIKEEINDDGAFVKEYVEIQHATNGQIFNSLAVMESEGVFLWNLNKNDEIIWKFKTENKIDARYVIETSRKRKFIGKSLSIEFDNKKVPTIEFNDNFKISYIRKFNKQRDDFNFTQTSYYAKGIGLYKYTRVFEKSQITYTLSEIISLAEFKKMKI